MASYHCAVKIGKAGKALAHAKYINREGKYKNSRVNESLAYTESGNMPEWVKDNPTAFWKAADIYERGGEKLSGRAYREIEIALPNELSIEENIFLTKEFVEMQLGENFPYSFAIHYKKATLDSEQEQPHAHIMFNERQIDGIERSKEHFFKRANTKNPALGGNKKNPIWTKNEKLLQVRKDYEVVQNKYLSLHGHEKTVDCRSYDAQRQDAINNGDMDKAEKFNNLPQKHLGPKICQRIKKNLQKYLGNAKTPSERAALREEYFEKVEPLNKVKIVYLAKSLTALQTKMAVYLKSKSASEDMLQERPVPVKEVAEILRSEIEEKKAQADKVFKEYLAAKKEVISEEIAFKMAVSKITKGEYTKVRKSFALNAENIQKWNEKSKAFSAKEKPAAFSFGERKKYDDEKALLVAEKQVLLAEKEKISHSKKLMEDHIAKPETKYQIEAIKNGILKANLPKKEQANKLYSQYKTLQAATGKIEKQHGILAKENPERKVSFPTNRSKVNIVRGTEKVLRELDKGSETRGLTARLYSDYER